jgi:hypothetical protein
VSARCLGKLKQWTLVPAFDYLIDEPSDPFPAPPVETAVQLLPFDRLLWENFERLCYRLVRANAECEDARLFGVKGQDQSGIDLYCRHAGGYSVYQCRRVETLTAAELAGAVSDFLDGEWSGSASCFVFCTSLSAARTQLAAEIKVQATRLKAKGIAFEVWDAEELSAQLKERAPSLVGDFFGLAWRDAFLPEDAVAGLSSQIADISSRLERLQNDSLRIRFIGWAPSLLRKAIEELGDADPTAYAKLDDAIGNPPDPTRVGAVAAHPPEWLSQADGRPWRVLAMTAEKFGEWDAAYRAWLALADRSHADARAGFLVAASVAADLGGESQISADLLDNAEQLSPAHPRVVLQRLDQSSLGAERLRTLEGVESDEPEVAALIAVHRATAHMLLSNMDEAERYVAEAERLLPDSITIKATAVNATIHRGRIASNEHQRVDYETLWRAQEDALQLRDKLRLARRYEESVRMIMLAADALTVVREPERARLLIGSATADELATAGAAEVLGDAALRASGWAEALFLTARALQTDGARRISASAHLEAGGLHEQNDALETLDELIAARGRETSLAALYRLAATTGRRQADWSDDAFDALLEGGYDSAAIAAKALFVGVRQRDYAAADALLQPYVEAPWADHARLQIALLRGEIADLRALADAFLARGAVQEDCVQCAAALVVAGDHARARDILSLTARDSATAPATRADAYSMLVPLLAERMNEWDEAARFHREWTELRPRDDRASAWAPRIANRLKRGH